MTKYKTSSGEVVNIDESPKTFEQAVEGLRRLERNTYGKIKITKWPKHVNDYYAFQSQDIPNAVHNLCCWILNDEGLITSIKQLGCRDNLEDGLDN